MCAQAKPTHQFHPDQFRCLACPPGDGRPYTPVEIIRDITPRQHRSSRTLSNPLPEGQMVNLSPVMRHRIASEGRIRLRAPESYSRPPAVAPKSGNKSNGTVERVPLSAYYDTKGNSISRVGPLNRCVALPTSHISMIGFFGYPRVNPLALLSIQR